MSDAYLRSWAEISLGRVVRNFHSIRDAAGRGVEVACVVKSEAYGHGAIEVSRALEGGGARWLAVSNIREGVALREAGIRSRILIMAECLPFDKEALTGHGLTPVVHSLADLAELDAYARSRGAVLPYHLKVDSGMGRLGVAGGAAEILPVVHQARSMRLEGLMTHFASATDFSSSQTEDQLRNFTSLVSELREAGLDPERIHLSSSGPVAYGQGASGGNMVRAGLALYGYVSRARGDAPPLAVNVEPALAWKARILVVKDVPAGAPIGYGALYRVPKPMKIAVIAAGYADGIPHQLSNRGAVIAAGQRVPILGAVSMDVTTVDVSGAPESRPGDAVMLLGREGLVSIDAQEIAALTGAIPYSVLCGIHPRVKRVYTE